MTKLSDELKMKVDPTSLQDEVFLSLMVTVDRMSRYHGQFMASYNVSPKQYNILRILRGAGASGLPVMEIGKRMIEKSPDVSRIIDRLIDLGLVKRRRQRNDRRVVIVNISSKGLDLLEKLQHPLSDYVRSLLMGVDDDELAQLVTLLDKVRDSIYAANKDIEI